MAEEKTEEPTSKKLEKVREEGQVAKSTDMVEFACLAAMLLALYAGGHYLADTMRADVIDALDFVSSDDHSVQALLATAGKMGRAALGVMLPVSILGVVAALVALAPQTGLKLSMKAINPKFDAVNPGNGIKRIFSMKSLLELVKMIVKAAVLFAVMWKTIEWLLPLVASSLYQPLPLLSAMLWSVFLKQLTVAVGIYLVIAAVDYRLQAWMFIRQNRMTKDEVKRERKDQDGDPMVKGERRRLARQFAMEQPAKARLARANMLVVNPTHYAVAVRYKPDEFPLPVVLAKGVDDEALMLRRLAFDMGVPIVANPPVARALHNVPEDEAIPEELFEVVAAILRWVDSVGARRAPEELAS
ncbi:type III secretion system protein [Burkholderia sp. WAC0059]|uniref:type III secretion system export apparatus subunit SctU n=1 Tax=Burkholderia sp. WAC0059 TaxID=2066022 RepID=UPI000C7F2E66|nr:type III secretion system export apparatus subunit SctU [Burkholderia sp. WAC0059]PLZ00290.1 type III secretion system protein [Burkholderia sp. WAC0059]